ncbi:MAG: hypothetical protein ACI4EE_00120 [Lachnospiraceae bacterium]
MRRAECRKPCWVLPEKERHSPWGKSCRLDFTYIRSVRLRRELQDYMWYQYQSGGKKPTTLRQENSCFRYYEAWLYERGIDSLFQIRQEDAEGFLTFLHTCVSKKTDRPLRLITQKHIYDTVRGIYHWYAMCRPEYAAMAQMFPTDVYQRMNRIVRTGYVEQSEVANFLQKLEQNRNPCLRWGGKILALTGLAPADLLGLRTDCIQSSGAGCFLRYYDHRKHSRQRIPVNEECVQAVQSLREQTEKFRRLAPREKRQQLFLHRDKHGQIITPDPDLFRYWMRRAQTDDLSKTDAASDKRCMTATMLRSALIDDMWERNVPYMVIRELGGYPLSAERRNLL